MGLEKGLLAVARVKHNLVKHNLVTQYRAEILVRGARIGIGPN